MRRCPLTYEGLPDDWPRPYGDAGLRGLARGLTDLADLPYSAAEQRREAAARATKMSVQGVQPKLSAKLRIKAGRLEIVDTGGDYILKPQTETYPHLPENEDLTMRLAACVGIEVPVHGLIRSRDGSWTYLIRRFDRLPRGRKLAVEDFAQLLGRTRATKYNASMEQVVSAVDRHTTFPLVEKLDLLRRTLFCFLTGGEDMHLKNFSVITRGPRVQLAPAYDLLNSTIALRNPTEEFALPLHGKQRNLRRGDLLDYFAEERLGLNRKVIDETLATLAAALPAWRELIDASFLTQELKEAYHGLLDERQSRLGI